MNTKNKKLAEGRLARIEFTKEKTRALRIENDLKENSMCPQTAPSEKKQDEPSSKSTTVQCCPVCLGTGLVQKGFYNQVGGFLSISSVSFEQCRSCQGLGFICLG